MKWLIFIFGSSLFGQTINLDKAQALGTAMATEFRKQAKPLDIPGVSALVERVGRRLAASSPGGDFRFEVVLTERTEPTGLPGGFVFVPASFLLAAEDEAEFAAMVAHAMGHVSLQHGFVSPRAGKEGPIPLFVEGGWLGAHADPQYRNASVPVGFLGAMRDRELEADRFGVQLAAKAGYDPAALGRYIRRVQPEESAAYSAVPIKAERLAALENMAGRAGEVGGSEFLRVREMVRAALPRVPERTVPSLRGN